MPHIDNSVDNDDEDDSNRVEVMTFSVGPPSANPRVPSDDPVEEGDSAMMDDNEMTTSFLPSNSANSSNNRSNNHRNAHFGLTASQVAAGVARPHSSLRLVLRKIGRYLAAVTLVTMLIMIPIVTYNQLRNRKLDVAAFESAGVMVLGTLVLSIRLVYQHFTHWYMPNVQKYVIRILWMVPLYAVQSWLSLRFKEARIYIDTIRDFYEAFVIASFVYYLIELLGGQDALVRTLRQKAQDHPDEAAHLGQHAFPLNLVLEKWDLGMEFMLQCKHGVLQYVVVKLVATALTFGFQWLGVYGEGQFKWNVAYPYLAFGINISVMYALYCLVKLFHAVNHELRNPIDWHPLGKFLCVKGVVFFTWWQGVVIFYLQAHGIIADIGSWTGDQVANGLIDYCVCIEMVAFAIAHAYTFTYTEYLPDHVEQAVTNSTATASGYRPPATLPRPMKFKDAFWSSTMPSETLQDIRRLRTGIDRVVSQANDPGIISLQDMPHSSSLSFGDHQHQSYDQTNDPLIPRRVGGDRGATRSTTDHQNIV